jgi:3-hydroxybutyryl-CoA dehydrogenase
MSEFTEAPAGEAGPARPVVGVVGLGSLGAPLLLSLCAHGYDTVGVDPRAGALDRVEHSINVLTMRQAGASVAKLGTDPAALEVADIVLEAVPDDLGAKRELLRLLDRTCPPEAVLVTTTDTLPLVCLAAASGRPGRVLGLRVPHPPQTGPGKPARIAATVERTAMTVPDAADQLDRLLAGLALAPAAAAPAATGDPAAAAAATRLVYGLLNRAVELLEEGYVPCEAIDTAMRLGCGLPAGPLQLVDEAGVDRVRDRLRALHWATGDSAYRPAPLLDAMIETGALGRKAGRGFSVAGTVAGSVAGPGDRTASAEPITPDTAAPAPAIGQVGQVGVLGSGTMGQGIAETLIVAGFDVVLVARTQDKAERAQAAIADRLTRAVRRGRLAPPDRQAALALLRPAGDLAELAACDVVIEAAAEDLDVKTRIFARLGALCRPDALLATTTSSLSVAACARASGRPDGVLGLHFFNPAPVMRLVELAVTPQTSPRTLARARDLCTRLGKTAVECPDRTGFIVNHLLFAYLNDAIRLLESGAADVEQTDAAVRAFGFPMGPYALLDTIGLDVSLAILRELDAAYGPARYAPPRLLIDLVAAGCLGAKNGRGFHHRAKR